MKETDPLVKKGKSETPIFVKEAKEKFLQLGKAYVKSIGTCPDQWTFFYPELKVTGKPFPYTNVKNNKLIPYKSEDEKIPENLRETFLVVAISMKKIASHGDVMNDNTLVQKRDELKVWLKKLSEALSKEEIKKSPGKEWTNALDEAAEFLEKYKNLSEEQLQSTTELKSACCQII